MTQINSDSHKKLGVLGGMGPQATAYFFQKVIDHTQAARDQDHVDMVIINQASIPDRTATIAAGDATEFLGVMEQNIRVLEAANVSHIAIPCNTSHFFLEQIQAKTQVPIINMIKETVAHAAQHFGAKKIAIMATDGTIKTELYQKECAAQGIESIIPSPADQNDVMRIIYGEIKAGKKADFAAFLNIAEELRAQGADAVILACTELSYLADEHEMPSYCIDALEVLVKKSIELSGKFYKK